MLILCLSLPQRVEGRITCFHARGGNSENLEFPEGEKKALIKEFKKKP